MCGITGFVALNSTCREDERQMIVSVERMANQLRHRGPDDGGTWADHRHGVALGFRRLAILDLTPAGHQPMVSASGRYVVVFNGEIYNHSELRQTLKVAGRAFRGTSDTEVLLAAVEHWGLKAAVRHFIGMFAIALWDRWEAKLHLVRDRMGEKPLYYGLHNGMFFFSSELKAMTVHPRFNGTVDRRALALLLQSGYIPSPYSIYSGIHKLTPGCVLTLDTSLDSSHELRPNPYWSVSESWAEAGQTSPASDTELLDELERRLTTAVGRQLIADVPVGAFLSGGIDSSLIVALAQKQSRRPVETFSIGFDEPQFNEAEHAKRVAKHLGTRHTEMYVGPGDALNVIPSLSSLYDEPMADSSQIPMYLVASLARQHVTVSLSGDGGDELFGGYTRYERAQQMWNTTRYVPRFAATVSSWLMKSRWFSRWRRSHLLQRRGFRLVESVASTQSPCAMYEPFVTAWPDAFQVVTGAGERSEESHNQLPGCTDFLRKLMARDLVTYLPDDILAKVDRATMGISLESRSPFLDHTIVDLSFQLPTRMLFHQGKAKWCLRQLLYRHVPPAMIERPKMGFGVPLNTWLRGPLRDWAEDLLDESRLKQEGFFDATSIRHVWNSHQSEKGQWAPQLWNVLTFQAWFKASRQVLSTRESMQFGTHRVA